MIYEVGVAPELRLGFQDSVMEVRVTSVTSGFKGALGIRFGSVGLLGWTGAPNSAKNENRNTFEKYLYLSSYQIFYWFK